MPLARPGTPFQERVWDELLAIPAGETASYAEIAARIGRPSAVRAVARANGMNRLALVVPCHRVIASDGKLAGYGGGVWRKAAIEERLIAPDGAFPPVGRSLAYRCGAFHLLAQSALRRMPAGPGEECRRELTTLLATRQPVETGPSQTESLGWRDRPIDRRPGARGRASIATNHLPAAQLRLKKRRIYSEATKGGMDWAYVVNRETL